MSKQIEERIVSMEFNNSSFEKNVKASMSTLEKLKQSLNFKGATKGLESIEKASSKVSFAPMNSAIDGVKVQFSGLQIAAATAMANITNSVVNAGKRIANEFTLKPITDGFHEYETQIGAIQTILSNTRWQNTSLDQVNTALDELNTYADKTIYNFTEMTRNIGTFTAAGVGLEDSVSAIKGIANLAAVSGSTSMQASSAMYQLSQALAAGRVSLMDWNSVVNAGMGGKVFQDALLRTSEIMGTGGKQAVEAYGSFRESLTKGAWLTTDVLTETLAQISGAYTEADLLAKGYTQDQAKEIVALAADATNAATNVRTFSQLMSTTMEALGSGWTNTWELLVGDFEEATQFWTSISNAINGAINESTDARNKLLQDWVDLGGRTALIDSLKTGFEGLLAILTPVKKAFENVFPPMTADKLMNITKSFQELMNGFKNFAQKAAPTVENVFTSIFSVFKAIGSVIGDVAGGIGEVISSITGTGDISQIVNQIADFVKGAADAITESNLLSGIVHTLASSFSGVLSTIAGIMTDGAGVFKDIFSGIGDILASVGRVILDTLSNIGSGLQEAIGKADIGNLLDVFNSGMLAALVTRLNGLFSKITGGVEDSTKGLFETLSETADKITESTSEILDSVRGSLEAWQTNIKTDILLKIAGAVAVLVASIAVLSSIDPDRLTDALGAITVLFMELIGAMTLFTKLNTSFEQLTGMGTMLMMATSIAILAMAMKSLASLDFDAIMRGMVAITGLAAVVTGMAKILGNGGSMIKGAGSMLILTGAIAALAGVMHILKSLSWEEVAVGLVTVGALLGEISIFTKVVNASELAKIGASMLLVSVGMSILSRSVIALSSIDMSGAITGLVAIGALMAEMIIAMRMMPKGSEIVKTAAGLLVMSVGLGAMIPVFDHFSKIDFDSAMIGLVAMGGTLKMFTEFLAPLMKMDFGKIASLGWALPELTGSLETIANAMVALGGMDAKGLVISLVAMNVAFKMLSRMIEQLDAIQVGDLAALSVALPVLAGSLEIMANAMIKFQGMGLESAGAAVFSMVGVMGALKLAISAVSGNEADVMMLLVVAVALDALAASIYIMSNIGVLGVAIGLTSLAASFTVIGIATKVLKPLIPTMYNIAGAIATFSGSMALLGIATGVMGAGMLVFMTGIAGAIAAIVAIDPAQAALGLVIIAGAFTTIGVAAKLLKPLIPSIMSLSASIASLGLACAAVSISLTLLVAGLMALGSVGEQGAMSIVNTLKAIIIGITEMVPQVLDGLMNSLKTILLSAIDVVVEVAPEIIDAIFKVLMQTLQSSTEYIPEMVGFVIDFVIQILNEVTSRLPELIPVINNFLHSLFDQISQAAASWSDEGLDFGIGAAVLAGIAASVVGFNAISSLVPGAMKGLALVGLFAVEMGAVIAALGMLQQIPGVDFLMSEGGNFLQNIGTAIGQFVGGIAGGFLEGATSTLPQVGTSLSEFMTNMMPFFMMAQMINPTSLQAVSTLVDVIGQLIGASFLDNVTSFIGGENDFGALGEKLIPFGEAMMGFSKVVAGLDSTSVMQAAMCGQALATLASSLPKEGGLAQAIFGKSPNLADFGTQMTQFGSALRGYSAQVTGLDFTSISASAQAGQALSTLANSLPKENGLSQAIFGENPGLDDFGNQMKLFGEALKTYSVSVAGLDTDAISQSVQAGEALVDLADMLPDSGGLAQWIFGGNDFGEFSESLDSFGEALKSYAEKMGEVDLSVISQSITLVKDLVTLVDGLSDMNTEGLTNLSSLDDVGSALSDYISSVGDYDTETISQSILALNNIRDFISSLVGFDSSGISSFQEAINNLANTSLSGLESIFSSADLSSAGTNLIQSLASGINSGIVQVGTALTNVISSAVSSISGTAEQFKTAGSLQVTAYAVAIQNGAAQVKTNVETMVSDAASALSGHYQEFYDAGYNLAQGFANGITDGSFASTIAAQAMANAAVKAAKDALAEKSPSRVMKKIGDYAAQGFTIGIRNGISDASKAGYSLADAAADGTRSLSAMYNSFADLDGAFSRITELSKKLAEAKKKDKKETEEEVEETSNLAEALDSVAESTQKIIDRRNDLNALQTLMTRQGLSFSDAFMTELMRSDGQYATALSEMLELTNDQLNELARIFDQSKAAEQMEDSVTSFMDLMSDAIDGVSKNRRKLKSLDKIFKTVGESFSDKFANEIMSGSSKYADALEYMATLTKEELLEIDKMFQQTKFDETLQSMTDAILEDDGLEFAFTALGSTIDDIADKLDDFGMDVDDVMSKVTEFGDAVADGFSKMSIKDQTSLQEYTDNLKNNMIVAKEYRNNVDRVFSQISDYPWAENFRKMVLEGGFEKFGKIMSEMASLGKNEILDIISLWNTNDLYGNQLGLEITDAIIPDRGVSQEIGTGIGSGVITGLSKGIQNGTESVKDNIVMLCTEIDDAAKNYFGIHSPSTLFEYYGKMIMEGLTHGMMMTDTNIENMFDWVERVSGYIAQITDTMSTYVPVIRPVFDISDLENKLNQPFTIHVKVIYDSTASNIDSVGANFKGSSTSSAMDNMADKLADKIDSIETGNTTFNQNNYSPKALSTADIYRQTKNQISLARDKVGKNTRYNKAQ